MIVCIAEKPSVARDIARIIGATASHDGYMEGNGYQVTWTFGHLCTLKEPGDSGELRIKEQVARKDDLFKRVGKYKSR